MHALLNRVLSSMEHGALISSAEPTALTDAFTQRSHAKYFSLEYTQSQSRKRHKPVAACRTTVYLT